MCFEANTALGDDADRRIIIPSNITTVADAAFKKCTAIREVEFVNKDTKLESNCFYECANLQEVKLPANLIYIPTYAFYKTKLSSVTIPKSITTVASQNGIEINAFGSLTSGKCEVTFEEGTDVDKLKIDANAFKDSAVVFNLPWTEDQHKEKFGSATYAFGAKSATFNFKNDGGNS